MQLNFTIYCASWVKNIVPDIINFLLAFVFLLFSAPANVVQWVKKQKKRASSHFARNFLVTQLLLLVRRLRSWSLRAMCNSIKRIFQLVPIKFTIESNEPTLRELLRFILRSLRRGDFSEPNFLASNEILWNLNFFPFRFVNFFLLFSSDKKTAEKILRVADKDRSRSRSYLVRN